MKGRVTLTIRKVVGREGRGGLKERSGENMGRERLEMEDMHYLRFIGKGEVMDELGVAR